MRAWNHLHYLVCHSWSVSDPRQFNHQASHHVPPVLVSPCSNNYGPHQFSEKLIPLTILDGLEAKPIHLYSRGENIRDWLFVTDHAKALLTINGVHRGERLGRGADA